MTTLGDIKTSFERNTNELNKVEYLGDGVYAFFDGYQVWIYTSNGYNKSDPIALDYYTTKALIEYAKKHYEGE